MKYILFIILGILIFIFFNNYNTFSIGVPEWWDRLKQTCAAVFLNPDSELIQSYNICNPSITDDILSQMRCMFEDGEIPECEISSGTTCHQSQRGLFPVIDKYYNPKMDGLDLQGNTEQMF